jgi:ABC-type amino acid transport substrate-binding protein
VLIQDYSSAANFATDPVRKAKIVQRLDGTDQYFGMAFQKNEKGAAMKADIDAALAELVADGSYVEIHKKWFGLDPDFTPGQKTLDEVLAAN